MLTQKIIKQFNTTTTTFPAGLKSQQVDASSRKDGFSEHPTPPQHLQQCSHFTACQYVHNMDNKNNNNNYYIIIITIIIIIIFDIE